MDEFWNTEASSGPLTRADIEAAIEKIRSMERVVHGSEQDPHVVHPDGGVCFGCGGWFDPRG